MNSVLSATTMSERLLFRNRWISALLRLGMGCVFVYAGCLKLHSAQNFADSIATFQILPDPFINVLALSLPPFEVIAGLMLIAGWQRRAAALSVVVLTVIFAAALGQAIARDLQVDCGCFGGGTPSFWRTWMALVRDLVLMAAGVLVYRNACGSDWFIAVDS